MTNTGLRGLWEARSTSGTKTPVKPLRAEADHWYSCCGSTAVVKLWQYNSCTAVAASAQRGFAMYVYARQKHDKAQTGHCRRCAQNAYPHVLAT
jgi:hypothetical protein